MLVNEKVQKLINDLTDVFPSSRIEHYHTSHVDCLECGRKHTTPHRTLCQECVDYFHAKKYEVN